MKLIIGDNTKRNMSILGINDYPFTAEELKVKFKVLIKQHHPDNGGDKDKAGELILAFKCLQNLAEDNFTDVRLEGIDGDIFALKETCTSCEGAGVHENVHFKEVFDYPTCGRCSGVGYKEKERLNPCPQCEGSGQYRKGSKIWTVVETIVRAHCSSCDGRGYTIFSPFNPVIPKGAVL